MRGVVGGCVYICTSRYISSARTRTCVSATVGGRGCVFTRRGQQAAAGGAHAKRAQTKRAAGLAPRTRCRPLRPGPDPARRWGRPGPPSHRPHPPTPPSARPLTSWRGRPALGSPHTPTPPPPHTHTPSRRARPRPRPGPGAARQPRRAEGVVPVRSPPRSGGPRSLALRPRPLSLPPLSPQAAARRVSRRPPRPPPPAAPPRVRGPVRRRPRRRRRGWTCREPSSGSASTRSAPR